MMAAMVYVRTDLRLGQTSMRTCTELVGATNNNKLAQTLPENCLTNTRDHSQAASLFAKQGEKMIFRNHL